MANDRQDQASHARDRRRTSYPLHKIVAAVESTHTDRVLTALGDAGFARGGIDVHTAEDVPELGQPIGGAGLLGFVRRLGLSTGGALDGIEQAHRELTYGHTLILVPVEDDAERDRAHEIRRQRGGHAMSDVGQWTITTLDGDTH